MLGRPRACQCARVAASTSSGLSSTSAALPQLLYGCVYGMGFALASSSEHALVRDMHGVGDLLCQTLPVGLLGGLKRGRRRRNVTWDRMPQAWHRPRGVCAGLQPRCAPAVRGGRRVACSLCGRSSIALWTLRRQYANFSCLQSTIKKLPGGRASDTGSRTYCAPRNCLAERLFRASGNKQESPQPQRSPLLRRRGASAPSQTRQPARHRPICLKGRHTRGVSGGGYRKSASQ